MNTHNIINEIIKEMPVLRAWHSFNPEKLQNIGGQGKDLLPLPNIKDLVTEDGTVNFPYIDILLEESKIAPQILVYSGELSKQQEQLFEDLHERAKAIGEKVFPINYEKIKDKLTYSSLLDFDRILKLNQAALRSIYSSGLERAERIAYKQAKADFIDLQRLIILYDMDSVFSFLEEEYPIKFNIKEILYADFDREIKRPLELVKNRDAKEWCNNGNNGLLFPASISLQRLDWPLDLTSRGNLSFESYNRKKKLPRCLKVELENNFLYCFKNKSTFIEKVIKKAEVKPGVFPIICQILCQPIQESLDQEGVNSIFYNHSLSVDFAPYRGDDEYYRAHDIIQTKTTQISLLLPERELEGAKDVSWSQDLPALILENYKRNKILTKLNELAEPEGQEISKVPTGL